MNLKGIPPALLLARDMGEWLRPSELRAAARELGVSLDYRHPPTAAFELISYIWQDELRVARLERMTRPVITQRMRG